MADFNIANNKTYKWTTVTGSILDEVPRIYVKSFKVTNNAINESVRSWYKIAESTVTGQSSDDYYNKLHKATVQDRWTIPFFNDEVRGFSNEWGDSFVSSTGQSKIAVGGALGEASELASVAIQTIEQGKSMLKGWFGDSSGGYGPLFEPPKFYQFAANDNALTVEFSLINTDEEGDWQKNYDLVQKLITDNRFERLNGIAVTPPLLWSVVVPGYRAIRWASCDVSVNLIGRRAIINDKIIPEGYKIQLTFKSLYTEPSNFSKHYSDTSAIE